MADIDIGKELLEKIRAEFPKICKADNYIQSVLQKIDDGIASLEEVALLSKQLGIRASQAIREYVKLSALPDGKMYYNIADTILTGVLKDNYDVINSAAAECQKALDRKAGINIRPQQAGFPVERIQAVASAASVPDIAEELMIRRMTAPTQNITESFFNDYIETNVKFRSKAGLDCFIIRNDHGGCCEWCSKLAGRYHYPEDVPKDVYRRHDNCGCTVTYVNGRKAQNVWDKTKWSISEEELEQMKKVGSRQPASLVDISEKSGIIGVESDDVAEIIELGKLNTQPLENEFGKLKTDELIVTNERIEHIKLRHPEDLDLFEKYGLSVVAGPDFIVKDEKNENTVFMTKKLENTNLNLVVKIILETDKKDLKNSVMTFYRIRDKNLKKLMNKNKTLYKKE